MKSFKKSGLLIAWAVGAFLMSSCKKTNDAASSVKNTTDKTSNTGADQVVDPGKLKVQSFDNSLIAFYPLAGNANDVTGNGHNGVVTNVTATSDELSGPGSAMHFTGTSSFIRVPDAASLRLSGTSFTVSAWIRLDSYNSGIGSAIVSKHSATSTGWMNTITGSSYTASSGPTGSGHVYFGSGGTGANAVTTHVASTGVGAWHMVTTVYTSAGASSSIKIYLDGSLDATTNASFTPSATDNGDLYIGTDNFTGGYNFAGDMSQLRIYNIALTAAQAASLFTETNDIYSLGAYWPLGGNATDFSGNGNNGTVLNNITWTTGHLGNAGSAAHFDGSTSYIQVPDAASLRLGGNFTVSAWIKPNNYSGVIPSVLSKHTTTAGWVLGLAGTNTTSGPTGSEAFINYNSNNAFGFVAVGTGNWSMLTVTYDKLHQVDSLYVNGILENTQTSVSTVTSSTAPLLIGGDSYFGYFNGDIEDIRIYNKRLNASQVSKLFGHKY